jgi:hypothetical protein
MVDVIFAEKNGTYADVPNLDIWDIKRDARLYAGGGPVVAHPPCARWCLLASLVEARYGHKKGDDGGCFTSALATVRRVGGVLEHPAYSAAWEAFGLNRPPSRGGWVTADDLGGWTCQVDQSRYGHKARKSTWLLVYGAPALPELRWGDRRHLPRGLVAVPRDRPVRPPIGALLYRGLQRKRRRQRLRNFEIC